MQAFNAFTLEPLSAGDIIDRAVRLYRRHFLVLLRIVIGPSLIAYAGGIMYTVGVRNFSVERGDTRVIAMTMLVLGGMFCYAVGKIIFFAMLGGMARELVGHFAGGTPLEARAVFRAVRHRALSLAGATMVVLMLVMFLLSLAYVVFFLALAIHLLVTGWLFAGAPAWLIGTLHILFGLLAAAGLLFLFLFAYSRIVFVPQALMVEEKGVIEAVIRSFTLAGRDVRKIAAILLFQIYIAWSLLLLFIIPLGWYGYLNGVDVNPFSDSAPLWYNITQQTLAQLSEILLSPIAMLSFTLLYLDVRVRREGFDVALLADRRLAPPPPLPPLPTLHTLPALPTLPTLPPSEEIPEEGEDVFASAGLIALNLETRQTAVESPAKVEDEEIELKN